MVSKRNSVLVTVIAAFLAAIVVAAVVAMFLPRSRAATRRGAQVAWSQSQGAGPQAAAAVRVPSIPRDAIARHGFRGPCVNCHVIEPAPVIGTDAVLPAEHKGQGVCSNCHVVEPAQGNPAMLLGGPGAGSGNFVCPGCGMTIAKPAGTPLRSITCPGCGTQMPCAQGNPAMLAGGPGGAFQRCFVCPNCRMSAMQPAGTPFRALNCPGCGGRMFCNQAAQGNPAMVVGGTGAGSGNFVCPGCGMTIVKPAGTPLRSITCPGCGTQMPCRQLQ